MTITWHHRVSTRSPIGSTSYIGISVSTNGKQMAQQIVVTFYKTAINDLRILAGDKVFVGLDEDAKSVAVKRDPAGSHTLSGGKKAGNALTISWRVNFGKTPTHYIDKNDITISPDGTVLIHAPFLFA